MAAKDTVFASKQERELWHKLKQRWGDRYTLYPNLPFLFAFDTKVLIDMNSWPEKVQGLTISDVERNRLKKTSIDYTVCDAADKPLVCIEFDGLQDGFNVGTRYRAAEPADPWRDQITSLKLKVAHGSLFPYFVVASKHFNDISQAVRVCIVDTLIGSVLAGQALHQAANNFQAKDVGMTDEEFDRLNPGQQHELIQDWFIGAEAEADLSHNPVFAAMWDVWDELRRRLGSVYHHTRFVYVPEIDDAVTPLERAKLMDSAILVGSECTVTTSQFGEVKRNILLPNFRSPGYSPYGFLDELAQLVSLDAVRALADARDRRNT